MMNEAMIVMETVERRRTTTTDFSPYAERFLRDSISWLERRKRKVTPKSLKDAACLLGQTLLGMDGFVIDVYQEAGNVRDYAQFLKGIGYAFEEEVQKDGSQDGV
jgi:hypothetical protein